MTDCLNTGTVQANTALNIGGLIGSLEANADIITCLNVGKITAVKQKGSLIGTVGANRTVTVTNSYASSESCEYVMYKATGAQNVTDANIQLAESKLKSATAQDNLTGFDWTNRWVTSDGFPKLKCFEPVAVKTKLTAQKLSLYQQVVKLFKQILQ